MELSINLKNKKDGYELIDGQNSTTISISKEKTWGIDKKLTPLLNYSTVSVVRSNAVSLKVDCFFHFTISQRTPLLQQSLYSDYQYFLYETISELRDKEMTFQQIAEHLNKKKIETVRGKKFRSPHVHSILNKRRNKEELKRKYPEEWSDFSLEIVDKSILLNYKFT